MAENNKAEGAPEGRVPLTDEEIDELGEPNCCPDHHDMWEPLLTENRTARLLLRQVHPDYCRATCPGRWDGDTWVPGVHEAICHDVAAFLGEPP